MTPEGASQGGSTNHDFRLPEAIGPPRSHLVSRTPFQRPPRSLFISFRQNLNQLLTNVEPSVHWLCCKTTNNIPKLFCRPPISNGYDHWLFLAFLNAQYNWLLQWLLPLKSVYLRKSSTQWAIDFFHLKSVHVQNPSKLNTIDYLVGKSPLAKLFGVTYKCCFQFKMLHSRNQATHTAFD